MRSENSHSATQQQSQAYTGKDHPDISIKRHMGRKKKWNEGQINTWKCSFQFPCYITVLRNLCCFITTILFTVRCIKNIFYWSPVNKPGYDKVIADVLEWKLWPPSSSWIYCIHRTKQKKEETRDFIFQEAHSIWRWQIPLCSLSSLVIPITFS